MSRTTRTARAARLVATAGVTAMLSTGAASLAFVFAGSAYAEPGVIGWDSVQAVGAFATQSGEASQVIGWD
ncbi:hypothetical protein ACWGHM_32000 [Streptomyces sp. NPDC054904]|uniref:hypothetical protein n=1 Tax=Streptomyces sp. NPDC090054 TaxID=3365933 RepID=UPI00382F0F8D